MARASWIYIKYLVFQHQPDLRGIGDSNLVRFLFPSGNLDVEVVWLLATQQEMVQEVCLARGVRLLPEDLKARLSERLRMSRTRALELLLVNL